MCLQLPSPLADKGFNFLLSGREIGEIFVLLKHSWRWSTGEGGLRTTRSIRMLTGRESCAGHGRGKGWEKGQSPALEDIGNV